VNLDFNKGLISGAGRLAFLAWPALVAPGRHPAITRAISLALAPSVMPGNNRRGSTPALPIVIAQRGAGRLPGRRACTRRQVGRTFSAGLQIGCQMSTPC
jgi:hypothetical protein